MDDKPTPEQPDQGLTKLDLNQLQSFSFGTQWTQDKPAGREDRRDDRPRREGADPRRDRRGFKRPAGAPDGADVERPREGRPEGGRPRFDRDRERGPAGTGGPGGPRREGRGEHPRGPRPGGERRHGGHPRNVEAADRAPYQSPHFNVTFYPDDTGFAALAKAMRSSSRTYELFEIAKVIIGKNDRFLAVVQRKDAGRPAEGEAGKPRGFFLSTPDGVPFDSEEAALDHLMKEHLATFFDTEEVEVEPPTGNFQVINRCPVTGELLGPPNYHLYNQILQQHHAAHIKQPLDVYRTRIETVRDPEVVAQWLEKMKKAVRYTWKGLPARPPRPGKNAAPAEGTAPVESAPAEAAAPESVSAAPAGPVEEVAASAPVAPAEGDTPAAEPNAEEAAVAEAPAAEQPSEEPAAEQPAVEAAPVVSFTSLDEARAHLLQQGRGRVIRTLDNLRFPGRSMEKLPDGEIRRAIEGQLERQRRFPLDTANALRGRLRREGFNIFKKGSKGVSYVCAVKRRFRQPGQQFADTLDALIRYIEAHPMVRQSELARKFLGIVPPGVPAASPEAEAHAAAASVPESAAPSETAGQAEGAEQAQAAAAEPAAAEAPASAAEAATPAASPEPELSTEDRARLIKMQYDLRWLVTEGYVTEFSDGRLFAPPPMPEARKREIEDGDDAENFPEAPAEETAEAPADESSEESAGPVAEASVEKQPAPAPAPSPTAPAAETAPAPEKAAGEGDPAR